MSILVITATHLDAFICEFRQRRSESERYSFTNSNVMRLVPLDPKQHTPASVSLLVLLLIHFLAAHAKTSVSGFVSLPVITVTLSVSHPTFASSL